MNFLDFKANYSHHYSYRKRIGTTNENSKFDNKSLRENFKKKLNNELSGSQHKRG